MIINTNYSAMNASRLLAGSVQAQRKSLARLSSGSRIVSPEDDAAGLAQAARLNNQSLRDNAALSVLQNSISFLQTKDGFLQKAVKAMDRMNELAVLAQDATKTDTDRANYNQEFQTLIAFINDISGKTFNDKSLFHSEYTKVTSANITWTDAKAAAVAAGGHLATVANASEMSAIIASVGTGDNLWIGLTDAGAEGATEGNFQWVTGEPLLYTNWGTNQPDDAFGGQDYAKYWDLSTTGIWDDDANAGSNMDGYILEKGAALVVNGDGQTISLETRGVPYLSDNLNTISAAETALTNVKSAISELARQRALVGSLITRVEGESEALRVKDENIRAAISRIQDVDVATESTNFARQSILVQSGTSMLAQANAIPQSALKLLS